MKKTHLLLVFISFLFLISCQSETPKSDQKQPTTFANFFVRFLQSENQVKANASFRTGMTQDLSKPIQIENGVFFHNGNMKEKKIPNVGIRYSYDYKGDFSDPYKFRFTDPLQGKMNYEVNVNPILNYSIKGDVSKSKGLTLTWEGTPLNENESLVFLFTAAKKNVPFEIKGKTASSTIEVPAEKLKTLEVGAAKVYLVRKQSHLHQEGNFVALSEMEFYTHETDIKIVP